MKLAEQYFHQAASIDLANNMGNASGGVHAAALGGLWQAATLGFAGIEAAEDHLRLDPRLPPSWRGLRFPIAYRGARLRVEVRPAELSLEIAAEAPVPIALAGGERRELPPGRTWRAARSGEGWGSWTERPC